MRRMLFPALLVAGTGSAIAQPSANPATSPASAPQSQPSIQQLFNQASEAEAEGNCVLAMPIFAKLASDPRVKPGSLAAGTIAVRNGNCLIDAGQPMEGERLVLAGLPVLKAAGPTMVGDVVKGENGLAQIAYRRWDHDAAIIHFSAALALTQGADRLYDLMELAKVSEFDGGAQPLAYADEGLAIATAQPKPDKPTISAFHTVRGRILMNRSQNREALSELKMAFDLSGGLTSRTSLSQVSIRGDLAQAELLNGDEDQARLYLAYTGAGRIQQSPFTLASVMAPPPCGIETGLTPQDSAIVEFSIGDDGDVTRAQTVYSRGSYQVASAFARAVSSWYWRPQDIAKVPAFYRLLTRLELRCSNGDAGQSDIITPIADRFAAWAKIRLPEAGSKPGHFGSAMAKLGRIADDATKSGDISQAVAALGVLGQIDPKPSAETAKKLDAALGLARQTNMPLEVIDALEVFRARVDLLLDSARRHADGARHSIDSALLGLAQAPALTRDGMAQDTLVLLALPTSPSHDQQAMTIDELTLVAGDARLAEHHPLRQRALLQLANMAAEQKEFGKAQSYFQRTGLSEQQCALIGATPALRSSGASSADYPMEALRMGFEGWVKLEFDITADGRTANARPVIAYPPFVFARAASGMARDMRYSISFRPSGGEACSAERQNISFNIPSNH